MIVLERIDFEAECAEFRVASGSLEDASRDFERVAVEAHRHGLRSVRMRLPSGEESRTLTPSTPSGRFGALALQAAGTSQVLHFVHGRPLYEFRVPHADSSLRALSTYTGLVFATHGPQQQDLSHLRLVLYELLANIFEHGRPCSADADLHLGLKMLERRVEGWIQDRCRPFDPFAATLAPIVDPVTRRRRRGYGLHIVRHYLTSFSHEHNGTGNKLTFSKEIKS